MKFLEPIEIQGRKFDRGMMLFEFDAFREPEKTRFPKIGEWLKARLSMVEIPTPQMYWRGEYWPDLYIANQLDALRDTDFGRFGMETFEAEFIDPMCRKISGRSYAEMEKQYHRALWLPEYWPQTLRARKSLRTPFWYPRAGYAGVVAERLGAGAGAAQRPAAPATLDHADLSLAFVLVRPRREFSVLFVVDESPIYRITDQDVCSGRSPEWHRWVVEFGGRGDILSLDQFAIDDVPMGRTAIKYTLPTIENVRKGWKPRPNINDHLWEIMNATASA